MIPDFFQSILWSSDVALLDADRHRRSIITATVNYGNLDHWRWIMNQYGISGVRQVLESLPATALRPRAAKLAALVFDVKQFSHAPRSSHTTA